MNLAVLYIHRGNEDGFNMMKIIVIISMKKKKVLHCNNTLLTYLQNKSKGLASILREIRSTFCTEFKSRIKKKKKQNQRKLDPALLFWTQMTLTKITSLNQSIVIN